MDRDELVETILTKFDDSDSDDENEYRSNLRGVQLSKRNNEEYQFKEAFRIVTDNRDSADIDQVGDVFLALGYTIHNDDIDEILKNVPTDTQEKYTCDILFREFIKWKEKQLLQEDLKDLFDYMMYSGKIPSEFPKITDTIRQQAQGKNVDQASVISILKSMLPANEANMINSSDADGLIDEIATTKFRNINFDDFQRLFV